MNIDIHDFYKDSAELQVVFTSKWIAKRREYWVVSTRGGTESGLPVSTPAGFCVFLSDPDPGPDLKILEQERSRSLKSDSGHLWWVLVLNKSDIFAILIQSNIFIEKSGPILIR